MRDPVGNQIRYRGYFDNLREMKLFLAEQSDAATTESMVRRAYKENFDELLKSLVYEYCEGLPLEELATSAGASLEKLKTNTALLHSEGGVFHPAYAKILPILTCQRLPIGFQTLILLLLPQTEQCKTFTNLVVVDIAHRFTHNS